VQPSIAQALRAEPAHELRVAVDQHALEQLGTGQPLELREPLQRRLFERGLQATFQEQRIDLAVAQVDADRVAIHRQHPTALLVIERGPEFAQAPAQLTAGVIGYVPQQVT
jgi:hypothetical protein